MTRTTASTFSRRPKAPHSEEVDRIRKIKDPVKRFMEAHELLDQIEKVDLPALAAAREVDPANLDLQQEGVGLQYSAGCLSVLRTEAIRVLHDKERMSFADVANLTGLREKAKRDGSPDEDESGQVIRVSSLSRQRVHQLYAGGKYTGTIRPAGRGSAKTLVGAGA